MRIGARIPAPPGAPLSEREAEDMVGRRLYVPDGEGKREIGYIVRADRRAGGLSVLAEIELHDEADRLIVDMRGYTLGMGLIG